MTDQEKRKAALDTLARRLVARSIKYFNLPRLSEEDQQALSRRAAAIRESINPSDEAWHAAYDHLAEQNPENRP